MTRQQETRNQIGKERKLDEEERKRDRKRERERKITKCRQGKLERKSKNAKEEIENYIAPSEVLITYS